MYLDDLNLNLNFNLKQLNANSVQTSDFNFRLQASRLANCLTRVQTQGAPKSTEW